MMEKKLENKSVINYSEFLNSEFEWLGKVPIHWDLIANKYIFKLKKIQVGKKFHDYPLLSLTLNGIVKRDMENPKGKFPAEFDSYQEVEIGDFVFCLFDIEETPRCVGLSDLRGMITGAYTVLGIIGNFDRKFLVTIQHPPTATSVFYPQINP